ncbi:MAG: mechanosensitive ion channel [Firmicutes bacterium]|nr:mechanosensitive ion channel [Bacillota bacterium]MBQ5959177.1 mechanosensitive ion channel [Bacillota bacterium]
MEKKNPKSIVKLIVYIVALAAIAGISLGTGLFKSVGDMLKGIHINLISIVQVIMMVLLVLALENLILWAVGLIKPKNPRAQTLLSIFGSIMRYITAIVIICWGLTILGANVGTIVAGVGIIALIIGFGAESLIADMVTGVFMLFENQYNVGDYIEVGGFRGKVTNIGIRTTSLEDAGGNVKIINNSMMTNLLNRSDHTSRAVSTIGIPYETDLEALEAKIPDMMKGILERHSDILLAEPVYLGVDALADSSVNLKFVAEVEDKDIFSAARVLNRELFLEFRKAGVEVPFPQVDVHQK